MFVLRGGGGINTVFLNRICYYLESFIESIYFILCEHKFASDECYDLDNYVKRNSIFFYLPYFILHKSVA